MSDPSRRELHDTRTVGPQIGRIALCTVGELFGGVERHLLGAMAALNEHGPRPLLILFHDGELAAQARALGHEPIILDNRNIALLATSRTLAKVLAQHMVHVVHVHGYKAAVFCALARRWYRTPMVKTEHGLPEATVAGLVRQWRNRFYYWVDSLATRVTRTTVCYVTEDLRSRYSKAHAGLRTFVIANGVPALDPKQYPCPSEMGRKGFHLLTVGRLDVVKGQHLAIEALASGLLEQDVQLYMLGEGPRESQLRDLARSRGVSDRVHMLGFRRNAYEYIANCKALVMPSLYEGLPYTLLEAMALGIPVVASRVGGIPEVIQDGVTGLLVVPESPEALAHAIRRLYEDENLRASLGEQGQALQRTQYSLDTMARRYCEVYRSIVQGA